MVYQEEFATRSEAMKREKYLKSGKGREELKQILEKRTRSSVG
jgi:predicted GIY-YIG superfamily endonuclease